MLLPALMAVAPPARAQDSIVVLVEHWPPWLVAHDEDRQQITDGIAVNLIREAFRRMGMTPVFETVPWVRALTQMEEGDADLIPVIARTEERTRHMVFTDPLYTDQLLLVTAAGDGSKQRCEWTRAGNMNERTVGTVRNYAYGARWRAFRKARNFSVVAANDDLTNLKKAAGGRLDYTVQFLSNLRANLAASEVDPQELSLCDRPIETIPLYVGISKQSPMAAHVEEFNQVLRAMKRDGTYQRLLGDLHPSGDSVLQLSHHP